MLAPAQEGLAILVISVRQEENHIVHNHIVHEVYNNHTVLITDNC